MATPEATFKKALREAFESLYGKKSETSMTGAIGVALGQPSGLPDRYFGAYGRFTWLEAKVAGCHKLTAIQELQLKRLAACGQQAVVATLLNYKMDRASWQVRVAKVFHSEIQPDESAAQFPWESIKIHSFWQYILRWHHASP
jgi:hypothetical protein